MLIPEDVRRDAGLRGHEIGADDRCERCGLSVADMAVSGRQRKDIVMKTMREAAERGGFSGFTHVLSSIEDRDPDAAATLRIWAAPPVLFPKSGHITFH